MCQSQQNCFKRTFSRKITNQTQKLGKLLLKKFETKTQSRRGRFRLKVHEKIRIKHKKLAILTCGKLRQKLRDVDLHIKILAH